MIPRSIALRTLVPGLLLGVALSLVTGCHEYRFHPVDYHGGIDIFDDLFAVSVPTADHIVAGGYWGAIYVSTDGGESFKKADTGTDSPINDVSMANSEKGWAVGQLGLLLRTEDGGLTWTPQDNPKLGNNHLFSIQALDASRAWAVGDWGTRIYTADGGKTWSDHSLTIDETHPQFVWLSLPDQDRVRAGEKVFEDVGLNDVYCLPAETNRCWMIGEFGYIFHTSTGGVTEDGATNWERGQIDSGFELGSIELGFNSIEIPAAGSESITRLANAIAGAEHLNIAIEPRVSAAEVAAFGSESDPYPIFEIIEARTQEVQTIVEDAGILSDRIRRRGAPPWDYEEFIAEDPGFLKRYYESRLREAPSVEVEISQNPVLFAVRFQDPQQGLISGLGGVILKSSDGGETWTYENVGRKQALFSVQPLPTRAITVGEKGFVRLSEDGGTTWTEVPGFPTLFTFMRDVAFDPDGRIGFVVGQRGTVLRSKDSGKSWTRVLPPEDDERARGV
jgi:photosystem II stability/assembly factor-like uncharacterized protein